MRLKTTSFKIIVPIFLFLVFLCTTAGATHLMPGEVIVKVTGGQSINHLIETYNLVKSDSIDSKNTYLLTFADSRSLEDVIQELSADNNVIRVTPNTSIDIPEVFQISQGFPDENRPIFNIGIEPASYYEQAGLYSIGLDSAQQLSVGTDVVVAVIDNGLDIDHPLFANTSIVGARDFLIGGNMPVEVEGTMYGHGTFVSGLLVLTAPEASLMPLRVFDENGYGDQFRVAKAIDWAVRQQADVINMSFGTEVMNEVLEESIIDAYEHGVVMVAASGNNGEEMYQYPAAHPFVIAVGAVNPDEYIAEFSNYGDHIDVVAPGVNIYSALAGSYEWGTWSGTSFAAPFVTGTIALMRPLTETYSADDYKEHLRNSSRSDLLWGGIAVPDNQYGYGMLDCYKSVWELCIGDLDGSGMRDIQDLSILVSYLNKNSNNSNPNSNANNGNGSVNSQGNGDVVLVFNEVLTALLADIDCDGEVSMSDVAVLVQHVFVQAHSFAPCY